jgi:hypothetical protein
VSDTLSGGITTAQQFTCFALNEHQYDCRDEAHSQRLQSDGSIMSRIAAPFNCLIRTHHITSRKKLRRVRHAAHQLGIANVLIRSGGSPGIMFAESESEDSLTSWVAEVQALRYKDFRCVARPSLADVSKAAKRASPLNGAVPRAIGFFETESVAEFAGQMKARGLESWWKRAMGYTAEDR